ncbi:hypothetical protein SUDANB180_00362 [Streptomyces sp. enrichment culture]
MMAVRVRRGEWAVATGAEDTGVVMGLAGRRVALSGFLGIGGRP